MSLGVAVVRDDRQARPPHTDGLPVSEIPATLSVLRWISTTEDRDRHWVQPVALAQRAVELSAGAPPAVRAVRTRPHTEGRHGNAPQFCSVPLGKSVRISMPSPRVDRRSDHDEVPMAHRIANCSGQPDIDVNGTIAEGLTDCFGDLTRRPVLGGVGQREPRASVSPLNAVWSM